MIYLFKIYVCSSITWTSLEEKFFKNYALLISYNEDNDKINIKDNDEN